MNKVFKSILAVVLAICMVPCVSAFADNPTDDASNYEIQPYLVNLESGKVDVYQEDGYMSFYVTTTSIDVVDEIYHTVTLLKNGKAVVSNKKYSLKNDCYILTVIDIDAEEGDVFKITVDHSAKDGSLVETRSSTKYAVYE